MNYSNQNYMLNSPNFYGLQNDYQMKGSGFNTEEFEHRSIGIQCSLPIDKSLILIAPRSVSE